MTHQAVSDKPRNWIPLLAMVVVFAAPVLAAWFFYFNPQYLPSTRSNRGELIQPVIPLSDAMGLREADGGTLDLNRFKDKWTLVSLSAAPCEAACREQRVVLRQIRLALGETRFSVERLQLLYGDSPQGGEVEAEPAFEGMQVAFADTRLLDALGEGEAALDRLYILDPMGNLMMRYAPDAPAKDTLKDMERLLKASKNWIKGASYGHR